MKKAKDIMTTKNLTRLVVGMAVLMTLLATYVVVTNRRPALISNTSGNECRSVVVVTSGDTLSKLLSDQGLSHSEITAIAEVLKSDAGISTLRADKDKIEFQREKDDSPVSKIVVIPSPWRQVELTCDQDLSLIHI